MLHSSLDYLWRLRSDAARFASCVETVFVRVSLLDASARAARRTSRGSPEGRAKSGWELGTISATGSGWAWGPAKENENRGLGRMAGGAARSRLAMEQLRPSNCLIRSVRD